jgi:hypothetical protein
MDWRIKLWKIKDKNKKLTNVEIRDIPKKFGYKIEKIRLKLIKILIIII